MDYSMYGENLPIFPCLDYAPITESRIERVVESLFNRADHSLMNGLATQEQYDNWSKAVNNWANEQYAKITKPLSPTVTDISTINEYGLEQKLSNSIRCF